mmetsp:Transcript_27010/g.37296  ORF Transcript_27010/g.37296 Transcript_27010/m.37296 type:complete len:209 (+) Transcript_27010:115-741(+)|eukprot:CAMPEP_0196579066 /NCGR_PEP_ID=MMETSP1081-20130531/17251_1 /TAXON_ID=36882 /ORGANISM="Pyramimonas amylifera, Strain CCMP720" /LENGTH=208 /DNA_ID=CAMNT_0041898515 /DNA_START=109 /DNA_END=735 /DNA_ORIENTATION=+
MPIDDDLENLLDDLSFTLGPVSPSITTKRDSVATFSNRDSSHCSYGNSKYSQKTLKPESPHNELDMLLADIGQIKTANKDLSSKVSASIKQESFSCGSSGAKVKCSAPSIGGSQFRQGPTGLGEVVCCDRLSCTKCDLTVISFENCRWAPDAEYMFFRNCYPNEDKLKAKLCPARGTRAYTCQCSWIGKDEPEVLGFNSSLRWVCRGH